MTRPWCPLQAFITFNVTNNNRHHHTISNGFTVIMGLVLVLLETVMNPVGLYW